MKKIVSIRCLVFLLGFTVSGAWASPSLKVDVKIEGKADNKGSSTKTQSRILNIAISNYGDDTVPDVKVNWWIFGHDMKDHKPIILKEGESKVVVPAKGEVKVVSPEVKVTGTREHKVSSRKGSGRSSRATAKMIPASGQEYYGHAVEVYSGNTLIDAYYSKPSFEKDLHPKGD